MKPTQVEVRRTTAKEQEFRKLTQEFAETVQQAGAAVAVARAHAAGLRCGRCDNSHRFYEWSDTQVKCAYCGKLLTVP
jgi:ribosomal protein S27E